MKYKNLIYLCFQTQEALKKSLSAVASSVEILEQGQLHAGCPTAWISAPEDLPTTQPEGLIDKTYLHNPHKDILRGYYKQTHVDVQKHLLTIESPHLGPLLKIVDRLIKEQNYEVIEISRAVYNNNKAVAHLANGNNVDIQYIKAAGVECQLVEAPSAEVLGLFCHRTK